MILNKRQQRNLFNNINSGLGGGGNVTFGSIIINVSGEADPMSIAQAVKQTEAERLREYNRTKRYSEAFA
jgi:hypothetical protein